MLARPHRLDDADGIYLKGQGRWCYLYRAIDRAGALVDVLFSEHRDMGERLVCPPLLMGL